MVKNIKRKARRVCCVGLEQFFGLAWVLRSEDDDGRYGCEDDEEKAVDQMRAGFIVTGFELVAADETHLASPLVLDFDTHVEVSIRPHENRHREHPAEGAADDTPPVLAEGFPDDGDRGQLADRRLNEVVGRDAQLLGHGRDDLAEAFTELGPLFDLLGRGDGVGLTLGQLLSVDHLSRDLGRQLGDIDRDGSGLRHSQTCGHDHENDHEHQRLH